MTTPAKPTLKCTAKTIFTVNYRDLERFIQEIFGKGYVMEAYEEWGNDESHDFEATGAEESGDAEMLAALRTGKPMPYSLGAILNALVRDGHISPGSYLVKVFW